MDRQIAEEWLNKLKEYWFNKDIEKAVSLFTKTTFYQEFDGIYEIKFNKNLECIYFKSWEMVK